VKTESIGERETRGLAVRTISTLLLATGLVLPVYADGPAGPRNATVAQLREVVANLEGKPDRDAAQALAGLELTERLSDAQRLPLEKGLVGPAAREALKMLAEASAFNDLPQAEILGTPAPSRGEQAALLAKTREYVVQTLQKLPNFFATRETENFQGTPKEAEHAEVRAKYEPLHAVSHSSVTVLYRNHRETIVKGKKQAPSNQQMRTLGEFGPILDTVFGDAAKGRIYWSHWEQGAAGQVAVFRYEVPEQQSHYQVSRTNIEQGDENDPGYHGEIAVDPSDGSILRVTVIAELKLDNPITSANLAVDYGPVEIGGRTYICPVKSVAVSDVRMVVQKLNFSTGALESTSLGAPKNYLNKVEFKDYHLFRAEMRVLDLDSH
jgi:hypothetical protein